MSAPDRRSWRGRSFNSRWDNPNPSTSRFNTSESYRRKNEKERETSSWNGPINTTQLPSGSYNNINFATEPMATRPALFQPHYYDIAADSTMFPFSGSLNFAGSSQKTGSTCTNELIDRLIMDEAYRMISNAARPMPNILFPYPPPPYHSHTIDHIQHQSRITEVPERATTPPSNIPSIEVSETHANDSIPTEKPAATNTSSSDLPLSTSSTIGERSRVLLERSAEQVTRKLIDQLATMNKSNLKEMINNPGTKYEMALKNHARNKLRAEIRRQLKNINLTANSRPDEEVGNFRPDESIDADKIPDALLQQIGQVLDFEFFNQLDPETEDAGNDHTPIVMDIPDSVDEIDSKPKTLSLVDHDTMNLPKSSQDFVNVPSDSDVDMDTSEISDKAPAIPSVEANLVSGPLANNDAVLSRIPESKTLSSQKLPEVISTANVVKGRLKPEIMVDATQSTQKEGQKFQNESISLLSDNQQKIKKYKNSMGKKSQSECRNIATSQKLNSNKNVNVKKGAMGNDESSAITDKNHSETSDLRKILPNLATDVVSLSHSICSLTNDANTFSATNIMAHKDKELRTKSPTAVPILGVSTKPIKPSIRIRTIVKPNLSLRKRAVSSNPKPSVSSIPSPSHDSEFRTKSPTPVAIHPEVSSNLRPWDRHNSRYSWSRHSGRRYNEAISTDQQKSPVAVLLSANDKRLDARVGDQYVSLGGFSLTYEHQADRTRRKTRHPWIVKPGDIRAYHRNIVPTVNGSDTDRISSDQSHIAVDQPVTAISTHAEPSDTSTLNATNSLHSNNPIEGVTDSTNGSRRHSPKTALPIVDSEPSAKKVKNLIKEKLLNRRDKLQSHAPSPKTANVLASTGSFLPKESDRSYSGIEDIQQVHKIQVVEKNIQKKQCLSAPDEPLSQPKRENVFPGDDYRKDPQPEDNELAAIPESDHQLPPERCSMKQDKAITRNDHLSNDRSASPFLSSNKTYQQSNDIDSLPPKDSDALPGIINELSAIDVGDSDNDAETLSYNISIDDGKETPTRGIAPDNPSEEYYNNVLEKEGVRKEDSVALENSSLTQDTERISQVQTGMIENVIENTRQLRTVPLASLTVNESNILESTQQKSSGSPMVCVHSWATEQDSQLNQEMVSSQRALNSPSPSRTKMTDYSKGSVEIDSDSSYKMPQELAQSIACSLDGIESIDLETMVLLRRKMDIDTEIMKLDAERMSIDQQLVKKQNERNRQMNRLRAAIFSSIEVGNCSSNGMDKKMVASKDDAKFPPICTNPAERTIQVDDNSSGLQDAYPAGSAQERTIRRITRLRLSENSELMRIFQRRRLLSERSSDGNPLTEDGVLIEQ